jgi:hypothetical protein
MTTLYAMTIDTEEEWDWNAGWPTSHPSVRNIGMLPRFQDLCSKFGAATTYFANKAVLDDAEARAILLDLAGREQTEVGMHIHPWNTPPIAGNGAVTVRDSYLHNLAKEVIWAKMESVYATFREHGLQPTSFRGGRYSSGGVIHDFLREHGFLADASVVPYYTWEDDGAPDYRSRGPQPVRIPPRVPGEPPFWEIPMTVGFSRRPARLWPRLFELVERTPARKLRLIGIAHRLGIVRRIWLNLESTRTDAVLALLRVLRPMKPLCVLFTVHSSSLVPGGNPYSATEAQVRRIWTTAGEVLATLASWADFRPATVAEISAELEAAYQRGRREPVLTA